MPSKLITILYVDDEVGLLNLGKEFLGRMGHFIVETAGSVQEAQGILRVSGIDAIVSDYQMPGQDGIEFLQEVRLDYQDLPFILFTGKGREEIAIQALNLGADFYLQKGGDPVAQFTELTHKIHSAVDRYQAKRKLVEYEERFSKIFGASPTPIILSKKTDGIILDANAGFERIFGLETWEISGKSFRDLSIWKDSLDYERIISLIVSEKSVRNLPLQLLDGNRNPLEILVSGESIRIRDTDCFLIQMHDVTETLRMQERLKESEDRYQLLFNNTLDAFSLNEVLCDPYGKPVDYRFLDVNPAFERITGFRKEDVIGKKILDVRPNMDRALLDIYGKVALSGTPVRFENFAADLDRFFDVQVFSPQKGQFALVFSEITEQRRVNEELQRKNNELGQLNEDLQATEEELRQSISDLSEKEHQLQESESHLAEAQRLAKIGSWDLDILTQKLFCTSETFRILGLNQSTDVLGFKDLQQFWHPDDWQELVQVSKRLLHEGQPYDLEHRLILPGGTQKFVRVQGEAIYKEESIVRIWGTIQDITHRRELTKALDHSETKFSSIFRASPAAITMSRFSDGTFLEVNQSFIDLMGFSPEEAIGHTSRELGVFVDYEDRMAMVAILNQDGGFRNRIFRLRRKDGAIIVAKVNAEILNLDQEKCILFMIEDITEEERAREELIRKNEELGQLNETLLGTEDELRLNIDELLSSREKLRVREEQYQAVFEHTGTSTFIIDPSGIVSLVNDPCLETTGYSREEIEGKMHWSSFIFPDETPLLQERHQKRLAGDKNLPDHYELRLIRKSGEIRHELLHIGMIPGTGQVIASLIDITDRKLTERAFAEGNRKLNLLTSIVRHDILNRMMVLQGNVVLAAKISTNPQVLEHLKKIEKSALHVDRMIRLTKEYESLGRQLPLWQKVGKLFEIAASPLDRNGVSFKVDAEGLEIFSDPLFERVFANLMENSLMHGQHVSEIRISWKTINGNLILTYEDNGVGVPPDMKERIFEMGVGKHTGLGLYLVRQVLGITDISIRECGVEGNGARFEMVVPAGAYRFV